MVVKEEDVLFSPEVFELEAMVVAVRRKPLLEEVM
jgi:hypothetical protein